MLDKNEKINILMTGCSLVGGSLASQNKEKLGIARRSNMPEMLEKILLSAGYKNASVHRASQAGSSLSEVLAREDQVAKIKQSHTHVIMYDNSSGYANSAKKIAQYARSSNPNVKLYARQSWPYTSGRSQNSIYNHNQKANYVARAIKGDVIRDGDVITAYYEKYGKAAGDKLFGDDHHQSIYGAYLIDLAIFCQITGDSVDDVKYRPYGIDKDLAEKMKAIVADTLDISKDSIKGNALNSDNDKTTENATDKNNESRQEETANKGDSKKKKSSNFTSNSQHVTNNTSYITNSGNILTTNGGSGVGINNFNKDKTLSAAESLKEAKSETYNAYSSLNGCLEPPYGFEGIKVEIVYTRRNLIERATEIIHDLRSLITQTENTANNLSSSETNNGGVSGSQTTYTSISTSFGSSGYDGSSGVSVGDSGQGNGNVNPASGNGTTEEHIYTLKEEIKMAQDWLKDKKEVTLQVITKSNQKLKVIALEPKKVDGETDKTEKIEYDNVAKELDPGEYKFKLIEINGDELTVEDDNGNRYIINRKDLTDMEYVDLYTKLTGKLVEVKKFNTTAAKGAEKVYFKELTVPEKYKVTPCNVQPMWYIASLDINYEGETTSGKKVKLGKGTKILVVKKSGFGYSNKYKDNECTCVIQNGQNKGEIVKLKVGQLNWLQQVTTPNTKYTKSTAERFINSHDVKSDTKYLIWINKNTQTFYIFEGSEHNWKCIKSWDCATGSYANSLACDVGNSWNFKVYGKNKVFRGINNYMPYTGPGCSGIHGLLNKKKIGFPQSHQCIRLTSEHRDYVYNNIPIGTRVVNF